MNNKRPVCLDFAMFLSATKKKKMVVIIATKVWLIRTDNLIGRKRLFNPNDGWLL